jgi:2-methylisocitrate lyase-like PEP mutase family enzyme
VNARIERANDFRKLHRKGEPLLLFNVWDALSAKAVADGGAKALATSSAAVARALGKDDGEQISIHELAGVVHRIIDAVDLPLTTDVEAGYGRSAAEVGENVKQIVEAGAIGVNFEDGIVGAEGLYPIEEQCARLEAVRDALATSNGYLNARVDVFLRAPRDQPHAPLLDAALTRAIAYLEHGADGIFLPGLSDPGLIETACYALECPVNILSWPGFPPVDVLAACGVARISLGSWPSREMARHITELAQAFHAVHRYPDGS